MRRQSGLLGIFARWGSFGQSKSSGQQVIRYDCYRLKAWEAAAGLGKGVGACGLLAFTFYRSWPVFFGMLPFGLFGIVRERRTRREKRLLELARQFKEGMMILASALSSGYSIENALLASREELVMLYGEAGMITEEFAHMTRQIRMNRPVEQALEDFAARSGLEDVQNFAEVFSVAKRSGGDLSGIMRHTAEVLRDKMQVKEEIRTMTASRLYEQRVMNLIPFFLVFYVELSSPGFFDQMYGTVTGRVVMSICMAAYLISYVLAGRILRIEV